jgi:hypothetical protein
MGVFHRGGTLGIMLGLLFLDILLLVDFFAYITYLLSCLGDNGGGSSPMDRLLSL